MADDAYLDNPLTERQIRTQVRQRLDALSKVIALFDDPETIPNPIDLLAMAEWVIDGSISAAAASHGQSLSAYMERQRDESE